MSINMYHGAITVPLRPPTNRLRWLPPLVFFLAVPFLRANLESLFVPRVPFNPSGGRSASGIGLVFASGGFFLPPVSSCWLRKAKVRGSFGRILRMEKCPSRMK